MLLLEQDKFNPDLFNLGGGMPSDEVCLFLIRGCPSYSRDTDVVKFISMSCVTLLNSERVCYNDHKAQSLLL